jgi:uncharacterized membrane protein
VHARWIRYEDFPRMTRGVRRVKQLDERHVLWDAQVAGRQQVWESEIVRHVPFERIVWRSRIGAVNEGIVRFEPAGEERTIVTLQLWYRPCGLLERLGDRLGLLHQQVRSDLARLARSLAAAHRELEPAAAAPGLRRSA